VGLLSNCCLRFRFIRAAGNRKAAGNRQGSIIAKASQKALETWFISPDKISFRQIQGKTQTPAERIRGRFFCVLTGVRDSVKGFSLFYANTFAWVFFCINLFEIFTEIEIGPF
jgi:hypothetical protein